LNSGYQPDETIKGFFEGKDGTRITRPNNIINIEKAGIYGQCSDGGVLNFLNPIERSTCSFIP